MESGLDDKVPFSLKRDRIRRGKRCPSRNRQILCAVVEPQGESQNRKRVSQRDHEILWHEGVSRKRIDAVLLTELLIKLQKGDVAAVTWMLQPGWSSVRVQRNFSLLVFGEFVRLGMEPESKRVGVLPLIFVDHHVAVGDQEKGTTSLIEETRSRSELRSAGILFHNGDGEVYSVNFDGAS